MLLKVVFECPYILFTFILVSGGGFPLYPELSYIISNAPAALSIIVGDAGFEPGTAASAI